MNRGVVEKVQQYCYFRSVQGFENAHHLQELDKEKQLIGELQHRSEKQRKRIQSLKENCSSRWSRDMGANEVNRHAKHL